MKNLILFIDCVNSNKQQLKVVSSCSVWSAISWSIEQGYTMAAPFLSKVSTIYTFLLKT